MLVSGPQVSVFARVATATLLRRRERFHTEVLMRLTGVMRSNSMLVLRTVKKTTAQRRL